LKEAIKNSTYNKIALKDLIIHSISGDWGIDEKDNPIENYIKCLVIRATEFDNIFNLNLKNSRVKYRYIHKIKYEKMDIQPNDLLIEKSGGSPKQPVGRVSILTDTILENHIIGFSNFIHKIRVNKELISPKYLFYYLKTLHNIKLTDAMQSQTNGIRNLIMNDYYNLNIVVPSIKKQNEIAEHIKTIKEQAGQLKAEAKDILENAKKEVEKMILGE
jgi:restriction endonuclease S subunit